VKSPFLDALEQRTLLGDGAVGTQLLARGYPGGAAIDEAALTQPDMLRRVHEDYLRAGADIIETNTFQASRVRLERAGLAEKVREINFRSARIARDAREISGQPAFVAGAVGPLGISLQPTGSLSLAEARQVFREQILALLEGGVDLIILETFPNVAELREALLAAREACDLPVVAQANFQQDMRTIAGEDPRQVLEALVVAGADVVGVNCGLGPQSALDVIEQMAASPLHSLLSAYPNAGLPRVVGGVSTYPATPAYFRDYARRLVEAGAAVVGGCCGTTPEHISAMREVIGGEWRRTARAERISTVAPSYPEHEPAPHAEGVETLREKLATKQFPVSVEIDPPRGLNPRKALEGAALMKEMGADCINVGDSPMARVRMSAISFTVLVQQQVGIEGIIHCTTRDRNLMALQSDLLGAHALGIRNVIALTGDPPTTGQVATTSGVWDVDSIGFIRVIKMLNEGVDWAGNSIGRATDFFVCCAANPTADDLQLELTRVRQKIEAGADCLMTQPVYDARLLREFLERLGPIDIPVLVGIMPLQSHRHAEFIHNELAGVSVPEEVRERMRLAGENGIAEGLAASQDFLQEVHGWVQGTYLMPSFGRYEVVGELVRSARALADR
jgi:homocysteine S-methyltransferase